MRRFAVLAGLLFFAVLTPSYAASLSAGQNQFVLRDMVYTSKDSITINELLGMETGLKGYIPARTNCFLPNAEIHGLMDRAGASDFILVGSGTYIVRIDKLSSISDLKDYISGSLQGRYQADNPDDFGLSEKFKILKISNEIVSNTMELFIDYVYFNGGTGAGTNRIINIPLEEKPEKDKALVAPVPDKIYYIENIDMGSADMIYSKGNIYIKMKVRIIRKLEDGTCLVENNTSGRLFKVRIKEPL